MDSEILLLVAVLLIIFSGSIIGWVNVFTLRRLRRDVDSLRSQLTQQPIQVAPTESTVPSQTDASTEQKADQPTAYSPQVQQKTVPNTIFQPPIAAQTPAESQPPAWLEHLKNHWMVWLGAICVGLAGIFLVAYSIEQDYLGPTTRISLGLITGLLLHVSAEYLRRRSLQREEASAGLAGGGSVTLYAALLASIHLYELWPTGLVFVLLAAVSLGTMMLALRHGPVLAIMGIVGAYAVPLLIGDEGGDVRIVLVYCLVIAGAGFWLLSRVYRSWLFYIILGGALSWCWLLLDQRQAFAFLPLYLFALSTMLVTIPYGRWQQIPEYQDDPLCRSLISFFRFPSPKQRDTAWGLLAVLLFDALTANMEQKYYVMHWLFMLSVAFTSRQRDESFKLIPWAAVILVFLNIVGSHLFWGQTGPTWPVELKASPTSPTLFATLVLVTALVIWFSIRTYRQNRYPALSLSLATLTPLMALAAAWMLGDVSFDAWYWAAVCVGLGAFYADRARRRWQTVADAQVVWWFIAAHAAYSLAAVMALSQASLTLALAVQVATIVWLMQRFELPLLRWLLRAVMTVIIVRLTLNPWLPEYATSSRLAGDTWVFWTYGGTLALVALARWLATGLKDTQRWLEGAMLHVLVLFIAVSVRYALYDGDVFVARYTFTEASLYTSLLAALGIVYAIRARRADASAALLRLAATLLLSASVAQYLWLAVVKNPLWQRIDAISSTPIANLLLLSFGLPVLLFALASRWGVAELRRAMSLIAAGALWWFVTLEVRHLWHGRLWWQGAIKDGELYSYSLSWLVLAVIAMLFGGWKQHQDAYRGGMLLLVVVIAKLFLIDLSDLTGLWRVLSFMGMGLCLIGLGWVHQVMLRRRTTA